MANEIAHTKNRTGQEQDLAEHLVQVATLAAAYAQPFGAATYARYAGIMHDIGKYDPAFQKRLLDAQAGRKAQKVDHKGAGTVLAATRDRSGLMAFLVAGHHGGLPAYNDLVETIKERGKQEAIRQVIATAQQAFPALREIVPSPDILRLGTKGKADLATSEQELFARMVFSCLVDADFLDTETHFLAGKRPERETCWTLAQLWETFGSWYEQRFPTRLVSRGSLNALRAQVYQYCLEASFEAPGFFRLTVPTGGGKTLASLAFGLRHAIQHYKSRVIYAIPYTSIIDQTVKVFLDVFGGDASAVLPHHSDLPIADPEVPSAVEIRRRLAAENWDVPLVVTTTVQFFESLFARSTTRCRKLHNIAGSVVILDEVQMLPIHLLTPILDALNQLVQHYGCTVLLCTATQPSLEQRKGFEGLHDIREIIPNPERYFVQLQRVEYQLPQPDEVWTWEDVASQMLQEHQAMAVLNTRRDAASVYEALQQESGILSADLFSLSTWMCSAHRKAVLEEVRRRLLAGEPCYLASTQVVEAGVDIDFPLVLRALATLDRIVQAAGRCNCEGKMAQLGQVIVFIPQDGHLPPGDYARGVRLTADLLSRPGADLHDPRLYEEYFREWYSYSQKLDKRKVQEARRRLDYPETARRFRMIEEEDSLTVIVPYPGAAEALAAFRQANPPRREHYRALQPYIVDVFNRDFEKARAQGMVEEITDGLWYWKGGYDAGIDGIHGQGILLP
jgi:CRISPR-associated endonuclease/helicase Cas3